MKNIKQEIAVYVQLGVFVTTWILLLHVTHSELKFNGQALRVLPDVVTVYIALSLLFTTWLWKIPWLQGWLVPFPNLNGTWRGTLKSTWVNPETGKSPEPILVVIVIKQKFSSVSCVMFTPESESYSTTAQINEDDASGILRLAYNYTNRSQATIRSRSEIHDGAAVLKIITAPSPILEGEYWTGRKTTGEISVFFKSRKYAQNF